MEIKYFCPLWGNVLPFENFLAQVSEAGYDGVEMSFPLDERERTLMADSIRKAGLEVIAQHWETTDPRFDNHKREYERRLRNLAAVNPLFINSQTGKDYYSAGRNAELIALADAIARETGVRIVHETHRGKFAFAAHVTQQYLAQHPALRLCLDISHWCCVSETLLEDQGDAIEAALIRTDHVHARVGHAEGPQIMDPSAPENQPVLERHLGWWREVVRLRRLDGNPTLTITTEFGAPPYLHLMPRSREPIYSQWEANVFMLRYLKANLV